jgi:hypothetical protein
LIVLATAAALGLVLWWHNHAVDAAREVGRRAADREWQAAFDTAHGAALNWRSAYQSTSTALVTIRKEAHEKDLRLNAAAADALRLHGPGRATAPVCGRRDAAVISGATGRHDAPAPVEDAPRPDLPANGGFAIVPWGWLVERAKEHDDLLSEVTTWRAWHPDQAAAHEAARANLSEIKPGFGD